MLYMHACCVHVCVCVHVWCVYTYTHVHMEVTLREVAMYLCVLVVYMCGVFTYVVVMSFLGVLQRIYSA